MAKKIQDIETNSVNLFGGSNEVFLPLAPEKYIQRKELGELYLPTSLHYWIMTVALLFMFYTPKVLSCKTVTQLHLKYWLFKDSLSTEYNNYSPITSVNFQQILLALSPIAKALPRSWNGKLSKTQSYGWCYVNNTNNLQWLITQQDIDNYIPPKFYNYPTVLFEEE